MQLSCNAGAAASQCTKRSLILAGRCVPFLNGVDSNHAHIGWQGGLHTGLHACPVHVHWCYTELDKSVCQPQDSFTSTPASRVRACMLGECRMSDGGSAHHAAGGIAIVGEDSCGEGAVVGADAHGTAQPLAFLHKWREQLCRGTDTIQWCGVRRQKPRLH